MPKSTFGPPSVKLDQPCIHGVKIRQAKFDGRTSYPTDIYASLAGWRDLALYPSDRDGGAAQPIRFDLVPDRSGWITAFGHPFTTGFG